MAGAGIGRSARLQRALTGLVVVALATLGHGGGAAAAPSTTTTTTSPPSLTTSAGTSETSCPDSAAATTCPAPVLKADAATDTAALDLVIDKPVTSAATADLRRRAAATLSGVDRLSSSVLRAEYLVRARVDSLTLLAQSAGGHARSTAHLVGKAEGCATTGGCYADSSLPLDVKMVGTEVELTVVMTRWDQLISGDVRLSLELVGTTETSALELTIQPCLYYLWCPGGPTVSVPHNPNYQASARSAAAITVLSVTPTYDRRPTPPRNLTNTAGATTVDLRWSAGPSPTPILGYRLVRNGVLVADERVLGSGATAFRETGLQPFQSYGYELTAVNAAGQSHPAYTWAYTTQRPAAPTITASARDCPAGPEYALDAPPPAVEVRWTDHDPGKHRITSHRIERSTGTEPFVAIAEIGNYYAPDSYVDCDVKPGTTYRYRAIAVGWDIGESDPSNVVSVTTNQGQDPTGPAPGAPTASAAGISTSTIRVSWSPAQKAPGETPTLFYNVYGSYPFDGCDPGNLETYCSVVIGRAPATATSWEHGGLSPGWQHTYWVTAVNVDGESEPSAPATASTLGTVPGAPLNPRAAADTGTRRADIRVSWGDANSNGAAVTSYRVYRSTGGDAETLLTTVNAPTSGCYNQCSFIDTKVTTGTTYSYRFAAVNSYGEGQRSSAVSASP